MEKLAFGRCFQDHATVEKLLLKKVFAEKVALICANMAMYVNDIAGAIKCAVTKLHALINSYDTLKHSNGLLIKPVFIFYSCFYN